jgi:hypothetical protein
MKTEEKNIHTKLLIFQNNVNKIKKDGQNPHFKSSYATLPQILGEVKPILTDLGLVLLQPVTDNKVMTLIIDSENPKDMVQASLDLPGGLSPQQAGSAITYYRRYLLAGLLSLEIEDDDGNAASQPAQQEDTREWLNKTVSKGSTELTDAWKKVTEALKSGNYGIADVEKKYRLNKEVKAELIQIQTNG